MVIVRDPHGTEPDDYFFTTDLAAVSAVVVQEYAGRWGVEEALRELKQSLGMDARAKLERGSRVAASPVRAGGPEPCRGVLLQSQ